MNTGFRYDHCTHRKIMKKEKNVIGQKFKNKFLLMAYKPEVAVTSDTYNV